MSTTKVLTPTAQEDADEFNANLSDSGCSCAVSNPPCGWCTHPGNPLNLEEDENAWQTPTIGHTLDVLLDVL